MCPSKKKQIKQNNKTGVTWSVDVDKMYSNVSMTWTMMINSPSNTVCSSRVFQQPTLLILTDVCKQSAAQPVQLSSTSQINTDSRQLSCPPFFPLLLFFYYRPAAYISPAYRFCMMRQILTWTLWRIYSPQEDHSGPDYSYKEGRRKQKAMFNWRNSKSPVCKNFKQTYLIQKPFLGHCQEGFLGGEKYQLTRSNIQNNITFVVLQANTFIR